MCCMFLLVGSPKISVHMIGIGGWFHLKSCLLSSYTCDKELFCHRLVTGDKTWIYHWAPLSKLEFMQWKDVDRPTFTRICKSAINWLDYGKFFWDTDGLLITDYLHPGKTTTGQYYTEPTFKSLHVIKQKQWRKLSLTSLTFSWQCTSTQVIGCSASSLQQWVCSTKLSCLQSRLGSQ